MAPGLSSATRRRTLRTGRRRSWRLLVACRLGWRRRAQSSGPLARRRLAVLPQRGFSPQFLVGFLEAELGAPAEPTGVHHFLPTCLLHRLAPHPSLPSQAGRAV